MPKSSEPNKVLSIHLHDKRMTTRRESRDEQAIIREIAGLEILIQNGQDGQWIFNRLKELAEKLK